MTGIALLDVNVLVALFDPDHVHHEPAHEWFSANRERGWATCPLTENGLVRILSNTAYTGIHETTAMVLRRLDTFCSSGNHTFWTDHLSLRDEHRFKLAAGSHAQITDIYLLGVAVDHDGRLATFDRRIPLRAVEGAMDEQLAVIPV
ncbi:MAG: TA system VapC family ribonuclease toxin [Acidobacteriota bacterium]